METPDFEKEARELVSDVSWGSAHSADLELGLKLIEYRAAIALRKAHDDALEEAAKVADSKREDIHGNDEWTSGRVDAAAEIAIDIRALKDTPATKEDGNG